jgi:hypothetical protein
MIRALSSRPSAFSEKRKPNGAERTKQRARADCTAFGFAEEARRGSLQHDQPGSPPYRLSTQLSPAPRSHAASATSKAVSTAVKKMVARQFRSVLAKHIEPEKGNVDRFGQPRGRIVDMGPLGAAS